MECGDPPKYILRRDSSQSSSQPKGRGVQQWNLWCEVLVVSSWKVLVSMEGTSVHDYPIDVRV